MDKDKFWLLIDSAREKAGWWQDMFEPLVESLSRLDAPDIIRFKQIFDEYRDLAYKDKLWAAASVMNNGCSDDHFMDFRAWLIAQGKESYLKVLADPDSLVELETVQAFARDVKELEYEPPNGYFDATFFEVMAYAAGDAYERKLGSGADIYQVLNDNPLSEQEKADIAAEISYAPDIDAKWGGIDVPDKVIWEEQKRLCPRLYQAFVEHDYTEAARPDRPAEPEPTNFEIKERVCANLSDGRHMAIIQALRKDTRDTVWAIGDDQVCAVTRADCVRNNGISYNSVLIQEFPYRDYSPESVGEWRPLIKELVDITLGKYLEHDGLVHVYPQWLPENLRHDMPPDIFAKICEQSDHIILRGGGIMDFVPKQSAGQESVLDKISQGRRDRKPPDPNKQKHKKHKKDEQEY